MLKKSVTEISEDLKSLYIETAKKLKGSDRRQFMAQVVQGGSNLKACLFQDVCTQQLIKGGRGDQIQNLPCNLIETSYLWSI